MNLKIIVVPFISLLFWACGSDSKTDLKKENAEKEKTQWTTIETRDGGYALRIFVPVPEIAKGEAVIEYLEDKGELRVTAGDEFDYSIYEDESQMNMVLNEINSHPFYKVEIIEKTDSTLLYRFYLENGAGESWHFYTERSLGQPLLMIRSNQTGEFDEFYARKMLESSLKLTALK